MFTKYRHSYMTLFLLRTLKQLILMFLFYIYRTQQTPASGSSPTIRGKLETNKGTLHRTGLHRIKCSVYMYYRFSKIYNYLTTSTRTVLNTQSYIRT